MSSTAATTTDSTALSLRDAGLTTPGSVGHAQTVIVDGAEGILITVDCDVSRGMPGTTIIGLGDSAVVQARDRIRSALRNSRIPWPGSKVVFSLSPAGIPKTGAGFDLALVCALLHAMNADPATGELLSRTIALGECALDGTIRAIPGIVPCVLAAADLPITTILVPLDNVDAARRATSLLGDAAPAIVGVPTITWLLQWLGARSLGLPDPPLPPTPHTTTHATTNPTATPHASSPLPPVELDMADVVGQPHARRAMEIAAAGGHNILLIGPPGTGKSMLAARLPGLLPDLTPEELAHSARIHSAAGDKGNVTAIFAGRRPFIAPHHGITEAALLGGGAHPKPGAVSLAHNGVLFLDEATEVRPAVLDALRIPLESGVVELMRQRRTVRFPAVFQLVLAANPCACAAATAQDCRCSAVTRQRYAQRISAPLLNRIDITAHTYPSRDGSLHSTEQESTATIRERVLRASRIARARWATEGTPCLNARVPGAWLRGTFAPTPDGTAMLEDLLRSGRVSHRRADRIMRVAWTIHDLELATSTPTCTDDDAPWLTSRPHLGHILDAVDFFTDAGIAHDNSFSDLPAPTSSAH